MKKYIGITIGPIFETLNLTSSPVALWASSYIFSLLSRTLCECLIEDGITEDAIVTPFYKKEDPLLNKKDGIGLFHDRIIFSSEGYDISRITSVKSRAIKTVAESFGISYDYLEEYIMVAAAEFEAENPILESGKILDSLELATPFVANEEINPIISLFNGDEYSKNSGIKNTDFVSSLENFQLKKGKDSFKSLKDIVSNGKGFKKYSYYAIVRSDGDNMSKIICNLGGDAEIRDFSKTCLEYCSAISEKVSEFGGVTIYSGGDDLLAILPCESRNSLTPFHFVKSANEIFYEHFGRYNQPTSLSFGITLAYYKFPLYEALEDSANLLFGVAKCGEKNRIALHLQKHAGQSEGMVISNDKIDAIINFLNTVKSSEASAESSDRTFLSSIHKIAMFENAFNHCDNVAQVYNLFNNIFDAFAHENNKFLHEDLPEFFLDLKNSVLVKAINDKGIVTDNPALTLCYILRILKFFTEKGGED